jgi:RNA polymerase sigma-70 factor (ECF subfamily)
MSIQRIETLILNMAQQDKNALSRLYDATNAKLFGVCLRILNDRAEAEDVLQEVYIKVWNAADRYIAGGTSPMTWLITIARNASIDRLRARRAPTDDIADHPQIASSAPGPEASLLAQDLRSQLIACLSELAADKAEAVQSAYLEGATYKELAEKYKVPLNTMRTWLRRSLLQLRNCLST